MQMPFIPPADPLRTWRQQQLARRRGKAARIFGPAAGPDQDGADAPDQDGAELDQIATGLLAEAISTEQEGNDHGSSQDTDGN